MLVSKGPECHQNMFVMRDSDKKAVKCDLFQPIRDIEGSKM